MKKMWFGLIAIIAIAIPAKGQYFFQPSYSYNVCYSTVANCGISMAGGVLQTLIMGHMATNLQNRQLNTVDFANALNSRRSVRAIKKIHQAVFCGACPRHPQYQRQSTPLTSRRLARKSASDPPSQEPAQVVANDPVATIENFFSFRVHLYVNGKKKFEVPAGTTIQLELLGGEQLSVKCSDGDIRALKQAANGLGWIITPRWLPDCRPT